MKLAFTLKMLNECETITIQLGMVHLTYKQDFFPCETKLLFDDTIWFSAKKYTPTPLKGK